jgi:hypothetical protein
VHSPIGYPPLEQKKANIGFWSLVVDEEVDDELSAFESTELRAWLSPIYIALNTG